MSRKEIIRVLVSAYAVGGVDAAVDAYDALQNEDPAAALEWLETYGSRTWQAKALAEINSEV